MNDTGGQSQQWGQSDRPGGTRGSDYKRGSNSPLRTKEASPYRGPHVPNFGSMHSGPGVDEFGSKARDLTPPTRLQPVPVGDPPRGRSPGSPLRQKSGSPTRSYPLPSTAVDRSRVSTQDYLN
jgi:hypothetical protein